MEPVETVSQTAESTPAVPTVAERIKNLNSDQRVQYDLTGDLPEITPSEPEKGKSETESEPVKQEPRKELTVEERSQRDRDRGEKRQSKYWRDRAEQLQRQLAEKAKPEAAPGKPPERPIAASTEPELVLPDFADFDTTADYNKAVAKAVSEHASKVADWKLDERDKARETKRRQREADEAAAEQNDVWTDKETTFIKANADYLPAKGNISKFFGTLPANDPLHQVEQALIDLEDPGVLHFLGKNSEEFMRILDLPVTRAIAELGKLQDRLAKAPIPNKHTKASDPPAKLGGKDESVTGPPVGSKQWNDQENEKDARRILGVTG